MSDQNQINIQILHKIPGRLRLSLSHKALDLLKMKKAVSLHPGVQDIRYTEITGSLLIHYDPDEIKMIEVILRCAVYLCSEYGLEKAELSFAHEHDDIGLGGYLSGGLLLAAALSTFFSGSTDLSRYLKPVAISSTIAAVLSHGAKEIKDHGMFDPEVLSIGYLLVSIVKKRGLSPAAITWATTYGRHLIMPEPEVLTITISGNRKNHTEEVKVARDNKHLLPLLRLLPVIVFDILTGGRVGKDTLLDQMEKISHSHDDLLEGLNQLESGYNLYIA